MSAHDSKRCGAKAGTGPTSMASGGLGGQARWWPWWYECRGRPRTHGAPAFAWTGMQRTLRTVGGTPNPAHSGEPPVNVHSWHAIPHSLPTSYAATRIAQPPVRYVASNSALYCSWQLLLLLLLQPSPLSLLPTKGPGISSASPNDSCKR